MPIAQQDAHGRVDAGDDPRGTRTFEDCLKHRVVLADVERPLSVKAFVIERQEWDRAVDRQHQLWMLDSLQLLPKQHDVRWADLMAEDLDDRGVELTPFEHGAQDQAHADFRANGDVGV